MITIEQLKVLSKPENIAITEYARIRLYERNISIDDIINGINTGEIIKQYPDDKPLAYFPDPDMWESDFKTRKGY